MDKIFLHGLRADTLIGLYDWERQHAQTLIFDIDIGINTQNHASDQIDDTVHYGIVCYTLRQHLKQQTFLLLETLAEDIAQLLFTQFNKIIWLRIRITKPGILADVREVGVEIERNRK